MLGTNAPTDLLPIQEVLLLLRARWQVALLCKLRKQHGLRDESRSRKPWRVPTEPFAQLLGLLVQRRVVLTGCGDRPNRCLVKRAHTLPAHAPQLRRTLIHRRLRTGCRLKPR